MNSARSPTLRKWIDQRLADTPPRAKSNVMTLFGDVIMPHGGWVWLGSLIQLLAPFGTSDRLVRTSVFRLVDEGWLSARREGRRSRYALNPAAAQRFERAYQRIYIPSYREWKGKWTLLFATTSTITREQKIHLRKELLWEGFGMLAPSVFGHPSADAQTLKEILLRVGVKGKVFVCDAFESGFATARPLCELIQQHWELEPVVTDYERFIKCFAALPKLLDASRSIEPEQAFVIRALLIHEFRRVQLHDQQLPLELLPGNWPGKTAYELCRQIYRSTYKEAEEYVLSILRREDEDAPLAAPYFYQRFGGLV
ncbi:MAG: phenylacetic acid degradation operon negative regulatory protein PaaX [Polaromonas sp.]|nr:phenylacetic acid degradation operon negative regulatory protein PaaX [Polaromonas sp.]